MNVHDHLKRLERIARQARDRGIRDVAAFTDQVITAAGAIATDERVAPEIRTQVRRVAKTLLLRLQEGASGALEDIDHIRRQLPARKYV